MRCVVDISSVAHRLSGPDALDSILSGLWSSGQIDGVVGVAPSIDAGELRRNIEPGWRERPPQAEHARAIDDYVSMMRSRGVEVFCAPGGDIVDALAALSEGQAVIMTGRKRARVLECDTFDGVWRVAEPVDQRELAIEILTSKVAPPIPGLGEKRARCVVEHYGSIEAIASSANLSNTGIPGLPWSVTQAIMQMSTRIAHWPKLYRPWRGINLRLAGETS